MLPYILLTLCVLTLALFDCTSRKWNELQYLMYAITAVFLILFVGFREVGFDYDNYRYYYDRLLVFWIDNSDVLRVEKGYALLNHLLPSYRTVLVVMAIITVSSQMYFLYKYSPAPFASLLFYIGSFLLISTMGQYRQAFAISLVIWAFINYEHRARFFLLIAIASAFHISSLLALTVLFIPKRVCKLKTYLYLFLIAVVSNLIASTIFFSMIEYMPPFIADKLGIYAESEKGAVLGFNMAMLLRIVVFYLFYKNRKEILKYKYGGLFLNIYFVSLLIYMGFGFLPQLAGRGAIYFYFIELVLAGMLVKIPRTGIAYFMFFAAISIYRQLSLFNEWAADYIPYRNELLTLGLS